MYNVLFAIVHCSWVIIQIKIKYIHLYLYYILALHTLSTRKIFSNEISNAIL